MGASLITEYFYPPNGSLAANRIPLSRRAVSPQQIGNRGRVPLATVGGQDLASIEFIGDALQPGYPGRADRVDFGKNVGGVFAVTCNSLDRLSTSLGLGFSPNKFLSEPLCV